MKEGRRGLVSGRVQGVWYRAFTRERAVAAGVTGWARNLSDGRVEVVLYGVSETVDHVATALLAGPPGARVDAIDWEPWTPADGQPPTDFVIG